MKCINPISLYINISISYLTAAKKETKPVSTETHKPILFTSNSSLDLGAYCDKNCSSTQR